MVHPFTDTNEHHLLVVTTLFVPLGAVTVWRVHDPQTVGLRDCSSGSRSMREQRERAEAVAGSCEQRDLFIGISRVLDEARASSTHLRIVPKVWT